MIKGNLKADAFELVQIDASADANRVWRVSAKIRILESAHPENTYSLMDIVGLPASVITDLLKLVQAIESAVASKLMASQENDTSTPSSSSLQDYLGEGKSI